MRSTFRRAMPMVIAVALAVGTITVPVTAQDAADALDFGSGSAIVELGGERYEFDMGTLQVGEEITVGACQSIFGIILAVGHVTDDRAISVEMEISPVDWEAKPEFGFDPPKIQLEDDDNDVVWVADARFDEVFAVETDSQAIAIENDGFDAIGTATFINSRAIHMGEAPESIEGTWEVHCDREE